MRPSSDTIRLSGSSPALRDRVLGLCRVTSWLVAASILIPSLVATAQPSTPTALRDDIRIERFADIAPRSIRIERDPVSGRLHYITFDGDVYEIRANGAAAASVMIATADDHGISRLQGMAFLDRFSKLGADLMHLKLFYSPVVDNYIVQSTRTVEGFNGPTDAALVDNVIYVIEYGGGDAGIWKLTLPAFRDPAMTAGSEADTR